MNLSEAREVAREMMDEDLSSVVSVEHNGRSAFNASMTRDYVEIDNIIGVRSILLCIDEDADEIDQGDQLVIDGMTFIAQAKQRRGRVTVAIVLGS